jgi:hypothetical protein
VADRDRFATEIGRFDSADARAYLRMMAEYDEVKSIFSESQFTPIGFGPSLDQRLAEHPRGDEPGGGHAGIGCACLLADLRPAVYRAGTAVLSTIHVTHLRDMAPREAWPEEFNYGVDTYDVGVPGFGVYLATSAPPVFETPDGPVTAVSAGVVGWPEDVVQLCQDLRAGRFVSAVPWLLVATPTLADPGRAPDGMHTVKLLSHQVYELPPGRDWATTKAEHARRQLAQLRAFAPGFTEDVILDYMVKSPADYEQLNPHMVHGAFHGGDRGLAFSGQLRPVPGWASHRMPIAGLYQTGGCTHPGGSITGAPGRNAAIVMLHDLGHDPAEVLKPRHAPPCRTSAVRRTRRR